jgi:hypothetical protein
VKKPTKEEVKAARALHKQGYVLIRKANKTLRKARLTRRHRIRKMNPAESAFRTWEHDMSVLMPAIARTPGAERWTPADLALWAATAADRMKDEVEARRPEGMDDRRRRRWHRGWSEWQELFDSLIHALSERSSLGVNEVIDRAAGLADAAMKIINKRARTTKRKAAA